MDTDSLFRKYAREGNLSSLSISHFPTMEQKNAYNAYLHREDIPGGCVSAWGSSPEEAIIAAMEAMRKEGIVTK